MLKRPVSLSSKDDEDSNPFSEEDPPHRNNQKKESNPQEDEDPPPRNDDKMKRRPLGNKGFFFSSLCLFLKLMYLLKLHLNL